MSVSEWIVCRIHSRDEQVLRLAELTHEDTYTTVGRAVEWFHWIDRHCSSARTGLTARSVNRIVGFSDSDPTNDRLDFASAMCQIGWVDVDQDGLIHVCGFDKNFARSAKRRASEAKRKQTARGRSPPDVRTSADKRPQSVRTGAPQEQQQHQQQYSVSGAPLGIADGPPPRRQQRMPERPKRQIERPPKGPTMASEQPQAEKPDNLTQAVWDALVAFQGGRMTGSLLVGECAELVGLVGEDAVIEGLPAARAAGCGGWRDARAWIKTRAGGKGFQKAKATATHDAVNDLPDEDFD